jgi:hypothetical protein
MGQQFRLFYLEVVLRAVAQLVPQAVILALQVLAGQHLAIVDIHQ